MTSKTVETQQKALKWHLSQVKTLQTRGSLSQALHYITNRKGIAPQDPQESQGQCPQKLPSAASEAQSRERLTLKRFACMTLSPIKANKTHRRTATFFNYIIKITILHQKHNDIKNWKQTWNDTLNGLIDQNPHWFHINVNQLLE